MAAKTTGQAERNFIQADLGILDCFGDLLEYRGTGTHELRMPHLVLHTSTGDKIIYVVSYGDRSKWEMVRGSQFGCTYIDEINLADIDFLAEIFMRSDYVMGTLNPDDPSLPVYRQYIDHCRPLPQYKNDTPQQIRTLMEETEPKEGWVHWFFSFDDNAGLPPEKKEQIITQAAPGTTKYRNLIQGLRGRFEGLVFPNFGASHIITPEEAHGMKFTRFSCGVDTAYSRISDDTTAFIYLGITSDGTLVILDESVVNNRDMTNPTAPSDTARRLDEFMRKNIHEWGHAGTVFIDSADQATMMECVKYLRANPRTWTVTNAWKKMRIIDRIQTQIGWLHTHDYLVVNTCKHHIHELQVYAWAADKAKPEDANDHTVNASQYGWIPYAGVTGKKDKKNKSK